MRQPSRNATLQQSLRGGRGVFLNAPAVDVHHDVVDHGRVIVGRAFGRHLDAVAPAVGDDVVGHDLVGRVVEDRNTGGDGARDDVVLHDGIRAADVDAVN